MPLESQRFIFGNKRYSANSTFYAMWEVQTFTISYNANGGTGAPSSQTKTYGTNITLSSTKPTRSGYTFQGWATSATGAVEYNPGATYTSNANLNLYAIWKLGDSQGPIEFITRKARYEFGTSLFQME